MAFGWVGGNRVVLFSKEGNMYIVRENGSLTIVDTCMQQAYKFDAQTRFQFILSCESFGGMESEPMLALREKSPLQEEFSPEED